jgi:hypothetical protein
MTSWVESMFSELALEAVVRAAVFTDSTKAEAVDTFLSQSSAAAQRKGPVSAAVTHVAKTRERLDYADIGRGGVKGP